MGTEERRIFTGRSKINGLVKGGRYTAYPLTCVFVENILTSHLVSPMNGGCRKPRMAMSLVLGGVLLARRIALLDSCQEDPRHLGLPKMNGAIVV